MEQINKQSNYYFSLLMATSKQIGEGRRFSLSKNGVIVFNYALLDQYINAAIVRIFRQYFKLGEICENIDYEYALEYDDNGELCLLVGSIDDSCTLVIYNDMHGYRPQFNGHRQLLYYSEKRLIEDAAVIKLIEKDRLANRSQIPSSISTLDRISSDLEYVEIRFDELFSEYFHRKGELFRSSGYESILKRSTENLINNIHKAYNKPGKRLVRAKCKNTHTGIENGDSRRVLEIIE